MEHFDITALAAWHRLESLADNLAGASMAELFSGDPARVDSYSLEAAGLYLDYSRNLVSDEIMKLLVDLAEQAPLASRREAMFRGEAINTTEGRPVLHSALRADPEQLRRDGLSDIAASIAAQKTRLREVSECIRSGRWLGVTGRAITDVVNLGIGGSDLGPRLACEALKEFAQPGLRCHFVSNVDGEVIRSTLAALDPETTLVIIASKTFTTQETLLNAGTAARWFEERLAIASAWASPHFLGVTATPGNARKLGLEDERILEFGQWVGGRYSLWSAIGLPIAIAIGYDNFQRLLDGARLMDEHFRTAPWRHNMPVVLGLLGVWHINFLRAETHGVVPYCERLCQLPFYLQQLDMESNGKSVALDGAAVHTGTAPVVWGTTGTNGQHSYFQLLHQGTHLVPVDFVAVARDNLTSPGHHRVLLANMVAQAAALMHGKGGDDLAPHRSYPGNRPSNTLVMDSLVPEALGALIALYEHKVFVQGCLWNINSFDQWGVELGKQLAGDLLDPALDASRLDPATRAMVARLRIR